MLLIDARTFSALSNIEKPSRVAAPTDKRSRVGI